MISNFLRRLPAFKGKRRLIRFLFSYLVNHANSLVVHGKYGCSYRLPNVKETIGFEIFVNGIYEEHTVKFISAKTPVGQYLLDIGANIGAISLPVKKNRPDISVISVEAAPWIFDYLLHNIQMNDMAGVEAINRAIAAKDDVVVQFFSPNEKYGKGSMAPVFTNSSVNVKTTTIDFLADRIAPLKIGFIKIDVEGFESEAFAGGLNLLRADDGPDILFEFVDWAEAAAGVNPGESQRLLMSYGYRLRVLQKNNLGEVLQKPITQGSLMLYASKKDTA